MSDDWPTTEAKFAQLFPQATKRRGAMSPPGRNFVTPEVLGFVQVGDEGVEVSTGCILGDRLFGVTFPRLADGGADPRDTSASSLDEVAMILVVAGLDDDQLAMEREIAPGMEAGGEDDPSREWTRKLDREASVRCR